MDGDICPKMEFNPPFYPYYEVLESNTKLQFLGICHSL